MITLKKRAKKDKTAVPSVFKTLGVKIANKYIDKDVLDNMDRAIKTVGGIDIDIPGSSKGIKMIPFTVQNIYEYLSAIVAYVIFVLFFCIYGILSGANPIGPVMIGFAIILYAVQRYRKPVATFKAKFESELPSFIDSMIQGLAVNMPIEQVISYIAETKSGIISAFMRDLENKLMTGISLEKALTEVSEKTLSADFDRIARILSFRSETTSEIVKGLEQIRDNIEIRLETQIMAKANNMENKLILPVMAGYVIPYLVIILYPLLTDLIRFFSSMTF